MKKLKLLFFPVTVLQVIFLIGAHAQPVLVGDPVLCVGQCGTFEVSLSNPDDDIAYIEWAASNGFSEVGENPVEICMDNSGFLSITAEGVTGLQDSFFLQFIVEGLGGAEPVITSVSALCPDSLSSCDRICAFNSAVYEVTNVPANAVVTWQVNGAEGFVSNGHEVSVDWGGPGQGQVSVSVNGGGGSGEPLQIYCGMAGFSVTNPGPVAGDGYLNIWGGTGPFDILLTGQSIMLSFSSTDRDLTFPSFLPGVYQVQVTDANGQTAFCEFVIAATDNECWLTLQPSVITHPSDCSVADGVIQLQPTGGSGGVNYQIIWNTGQFGLGQSGLSAGTYSITITDSAGCSHSVEIELACPSTGCAGESTLCVEILEEPQAIIGSVPSASNGTIEICQGQTVFFENNSEGASSYIWDFGDLATSPQFEPSHTYHAPGTYTVALIARNACFCNDTTFVNVHVAPADVPEINCTGTVCEGESVTYSTEVNCGSYTWNITGGGTVLDGGGPADNFITVQWNSGPQGTVSLAVSGCAGNVCTATNVVPIPVIGGSAQITGRTEVCEGSTEDYSIPNYQGTEITWSVIGSGNIVSGQGTERISVHWFGAANQGNPQQVVVSYNNCYLDCGGADTLNVNILPSFYLKGPIQVCEKTMAGYTAYNSITNAQEALVWQVVDGGNNIVWTSAGAAASVTIDWSFAPGTYTVLGRPLLPGSFCNPFYKIFVEIMPLPPPPDNIAGVVEICPGAIYTYTADGLPGNIFNWTVAGGTPLSFHGDAINVTWGSTPPYQLYLTQTATTGPGCTSDPIALNVSALPAFQISGDGQVCLEEKGNYSVPFFENVEYQWSLSPADRGTVVSGQGTPDVEVLWHDSGMAVVSVSVCGMAENFNVEVLSPPVPTVLHPNEICRGTVAAVSTFLSYDSYQWLNENGALVSTDAAPNLLPGWYEVRVVDANGCEGNTSFDILELPEPAVTVSVPIYLGLCPGGPSVTITASTTTDGYDFQWFRNGSPTGTNSPYLTTDLVGSYQVEVTDQNGCTNQSNTVVLADCASAGGVCVNGICTAPGAGGIPGSGCAPDGNISFEIQQTADCLTHQYVNTSTNDVAGSWSWTFGDPLSGPANTSNLENPVHTFSDVGFYPIIFLGAVPDLNSAGTCPGGQLQQDTILVIPDFSFETACPGTPVVFTDLSEIMPFATLSGWQWDFGDPASGAANTSTDQHPSHIYQTSGTYTVGLTVTEASGCQVSAVKNVIVPDVPVISFAPPAISCQQTALPFNASISADVISLQWDFGDPGSGAANTATDAATFHQYDIPGIYTVSLTATNVFGCTATYTDDVVVTANTLNGSITYQPPSPLCEGDNTILTAPAGGSAYQWSTGEQTAQITVAATGVYKVTMTGTNGCTYSPPPAPVDVFEQPNGIIMAVEYNEFGQPVAFFENSYSTCEGEDVHLIVQGSLNYSYQWSGGNGSGTGISFTLDRDNLLTPGDHHFTVTVTDNTTGCTGVEGPFTVTVHPKPEVEIASVPSGFLCENDPATLSVVNPGTGLAYIWNTGETGTSIEVVAGGVYFAQATNQFGCKSRSNEITLHNAPDIDIIPAGCYTRCNPDTLCLPDMSSVASFQWFLDGVPLPAPNGTQPEPVFDQSGGYHVILTDVYGCKSISDVLTLDLIPGFGDITGNVWFDVNHNGVIDGPDTLVSGIPIILNDGTGYADTVLSDLTGYIFSGVPANGYSVVLDTTGLPAGWSAYYTSTNVQLTGCDVEEHFDWLLTLCLPQTLSETHYACPGDGITYDGTFIPAGTTDTFAYTSADGCDSILIIAVEAFEVSAQQVELGACEGTTVSYEGTVLSVGDQQDFVFTDINGCDSVVQVSVVGWPVYAQPLELYACDGAPVFYNGQTFYAGDQQDFLFTSVNGCDSLIQLSVVGADPDSTAIDLEVCEGETIGYNGQQLAAGDSVVFSFTNQYGCDSMVMVSVAQYPPVSFDLSGEEVCWNAADGQIEVQNVSGGLPPWLVSLNGTDYQPALTFDNLASGSYTVYLLDANDCLYTQLVELPEIGPIEVQPTDTTMQCGDVLQLAPVVVSPLPVTWQWDDDGSTQPVLSVTAPGVYGFTASNDCESVSAAVTVRLEATATDRLIYMPNSFSPNGDAVNDCYHGFLAPDTAPDYFVLKIFDRWGDLVFETNDPDACWDGTFRGRQMQPAVFAYFMEMRMLNCDGNPVGVFKEGDIHLIR